MIFKERGGGGGGGWGGGQKGGYIGRLFFCHLSTTFALCMPFHRIEREKIMSKHGARNPSTAWQVQNILLHNHTSLNTSHFLIHHQKYVKSLYDHTQSSTYSIQVFS